MGNKINYSSTLSSRAQKEIAISWEWYEERQNIIKQICAGHHAL